MKITKSILVALSLIAFCATTASAATIVVKKDGTGTTTSVAGAARLAAEGDVIEIQDSGVYDETDQVVVTNKTLRGAVGQRPTIKNSTLTADQKGVAQGVVVQAINGTIQNLNIVGYGPNKYWQNGIWCYGTCNFDNLGIYGFSSAGIRFLIKKDQPKMTGSLTNSYVANCWTPVDFEVYWTKGTDPDADQPGADLVGDFLIDHCTLIGWDNGVVILRKYWPTTGGELTVTNSIVGDYKGLDPENTTFNSKYPAQAVFASDTITQSGPEKARTGLDIKHSYNAYICIWMLFWNWNDHDFKSTNPIGPTEIGAMNPDRINCRFKDPNNNDFSLNSDSPLIGRCADGSTIGAWQSATKTRVPQVLVNKNAPNANGVYSSIFACLGKANGIPITSVGDLIEIQDSEVYNEPTANDIVLKGVSLRGAAGQKPTVTRTAPKNGQIINCYDSLLENLIIKGVDDGSAQGVVTGRSITIKNCTFNGFQKSLALNSGCSPNTPNIGNISYTYFINCGNPAINLAGWSTPKIADIAPFVVDHCTIITNDNNPVTLSKEYPGDGSNITVSNSILANVTEGAFVKASVFAGVEKDTVAIKHHHNCYPSLWLLYYVNGDETKAGTPDATDMADVDPLFKDMAAGNFELKDNTPLWMKGEKVNGKATTIGAFQIAPLNAVKTWEVLN